MNKTTKTTVAVLLMASLAPLWRSGAKGDLNFWEFVANHTIFIDDPEYIPRENYMEQFNGI